MSRTYRRKTHKSGLYEFEEWPGVYRVQWKFGNKTYFSKCGFGKHEDFAPLTKDQSAKEKAKFHADAFFTMRNAPKWYRQMLNRKLRRKQNRSIEGVTDYDEYADPKFIKDAPWYW